MVKVGKYDYHKSTRKDKKLMVNVDRPTGGMTWIHFGGDPSSATHYFDKTGLLDKKLNHKDKKKRAAWIARHSAIKTKDGKRVIDNPYSAAYHSLRVLW
jgi:hypothetical protein